MKNVAMRDVPLTKLPIMAPLYPGQMITVQQMNGKIEARDFTHVQTTVQERK